MVWRAMAFAGIAYFAAGQLPCAVPAPVSCVLAAWHERVQIHAAYHIALLTSHAALPLDIG